ncbi:MAG: tRNA (N6-isopentenyl adenosine(37)-C2)-methylthiotransferase MiaB [Bacillota bacterium]|nr:MAG: tRNA (N6-isopentenyl adenosine(37)-C2)-methylthiotransferase MiaB [Bacillota bacterium]
MSQSYHVITYGCQMNVHDSEVLAGLLENMGYRRAGEPEQADLILLNTCCVRETAEERILGRLGELQRLKRENPDLILVVAGCLGQEAGSVERILRRAAQVDIVMGTHNLHRLPDLVREVLTGRNGNGAGTLVEIWDEPAGEQWRQGLPIMRERGVRAWVTIMYGCDNYCAYCIVPYVRGRERSREPADIVAEVDDLAKRGYREVVLLGQNVNSYGLDLEPGPGPGRRFASLLRELDKTQGLARIRYTTSHPRNFGDDIIEAVADCGKVCENFHLPVQSGSSRVLGLMNRHYTREDYLALVEGIRRRVPGAAFSTDVIVGFPGETDKDFEDTLELVREVRFDSAFTFAYSPRVGTPAARAPDQVAPEVKQDRLRRLIETQNEISLEINRAQIGREVEVLVEGEAEKAPGMAAGRDRVNKLVVLSPPEGTTVTELVGREVVVRVEKATTWSLEGRADSP